MGFLASVNALLKRVAPDAVIVPMVVGRLTLAEVRKAAAHLLVMIVVDIYDRRAAVRERDLKRDVEAQLKERNR